MKFWARDFPLDNDAPQLGRPGEVDSDQIETLTENNQCSNMQEIAYILKISQLIVIGENEKMHLLFYRKKHKVLFGQSNRKCYPNLYKVGQK